MISRVRGTLESRDVDRIEILTAGGTAYEVMIPLGVFERLPARGGEVSLVTQLVVRDDGWHLYGFNSESERRLFQRLMGVSGIGPALALAMLSALAPERLARAIREKDVSILQRVPRVGRKTAERVVLELADKLGDFAADDGAEPLEARVTGAAEDAVKALESLGYSFTAAEKAVRAALDAESDGDLTSLIRSALSHISAR